ncbi:MAG: hypothetical protein ACKO23_17390 [Gemmataceae bacterium]
MRYLAILLVPLVLAQAAEAQTTRKTKKRPEIWAVSHQAEQNQANALQQGGGAVVNAPANQLQGGPGNPEIIVPGGESVALPAGQQTCAPGQDCHGGSCGNAGGCRGCLSRFSQWFCFKPSRGCAKGCGCGSYCHPPLYTFFQKPCKEGANYQTQQGCSSCSKGGNSWGSVYQTGHRMFAMPTGHGVPGIQ